MEPYRSTSGKKSGATGFEIGEDRIIIEFGDRCYLYTIASCGQTHIQAMMRLARASQGLSTYITRNKPPYEDKW